MNVRNYLFDFAVLFLVALSGMCFATPSTQIWNPSTDIQAKGSWHLGIDDYVTVDDRVSGGYSFPTDYGLTYGLLPGLEIGFDALFPQAVPGSSMVLNAKYGVPENGPLPSFAIGGYGFGLQSGVTDQNIIYGVAARTFPLGRITAGYFAGNEKLLVDTAGVKDNAGLILTWDKMLTDRLWACVDYAGTNSAVGAAFYGVSWLFAPNTSVIFGYGTYNNGAKPTVTTQLDINL